MRTAAYAVTRAQAGSQEAAAHLRTLNPDVVAAASQRAKVDAAQADMVIESAKNLDRFHVAKVDGQIDAGKRAKATADVLGSLSGLMQVYAAANTGWQKYRPYTSAQEDAAIKAAVEQLKAAHLEPMAERLEYGRTITDLDSKMAVMGSVRDMIQTISKEELGEYKDVPGVREHWDKISTRAPAPLLPGARQDEARPIDVSIDTKPRKGGGAPQGTQFKSLKGDR